LTIWGVKKMCWTVPKIARYGYTTIAMIGAVGRTISQSPSEGLAVHRTDVPTGSAQHVIVSKFHELISALEHRSSRLRLEVRKLAAAATTAKGAATAAARWRDHLPHWQLMTPQRAYEGFKEMVGGSGANSSCYVLLRLAEAGEGAGAAKRKKVLSVNEVNDWVDFKPTIIHETLSIEDAEEVRTPTQETNPSQKIRSVGMRDVMGNVFAARLRENGV